MNSRKVSHGIAISWDSKYAFISVDGIGIEPGSVDIIDLEKLERVAVVEVGKQAFENTWTFPFLLVFLTKVHEQLHPGIVLVCHDSLEADSSVEISGF